MCFDAGFTLVRPANDIPSIVTDVLSEMGWVYAVGAVEAACRRAEDSYWQRYRRVGTRWTSDSAIEAEWHRYFTLVVSGLGIDSDPDRAVHLLLERHDSPGAWVAFPEVAEVLARFHAQGTRIAVISDWSTGLSKVLETSDLAPHIDFVFASAATGFAKPDVRVYQHALVVSGSGAHNAVMVGDSYFADVLPARAAGMAAVLLQRDEPRATRVERVPRGEDRIRGLGELIGELQVRARERPREAGRLGPMTARDIERQVKREDLVI